MNVLVLILFFSILGSIGSVAGAALLLLFSESVRKTLVPSLIGYAAGTLLGAAFLGMIPHALEHAIVKLRKEVCDVKHNLESWNEILYSCLYGGWVDLHMKKR